MMRASHMMSATPNDVCLRAHGGKHHIIANGVSNIIMSEANNIIDCRKAIYIIDSSMILWYTKFKKRRYGYERKQTCGNVYEFFR